jgi:hypothetical protein
MADSANTDCKYVASEREKAVTDWISAISACLAAIMAFVAAYFSWHQENILKDQTRAAYESVVYSKQVDSTGTFMTNAGNMYKLIFSIIWEMAYTAPNSRLEKLKGHHEEIDKNASKLIEVYEPAKLQFSPLMRIDAGNLIDLAQSLRYYSSSAAVLKDSEKDLAEEFYYSASAYVNVFNEMTMCSEALFDYGHPFKAVENEKCTYLGWARDLEKLENMIDKDSEDAELIKRQHARAAFPASAKIPPWTP